MKNYHIPFIIIVLIFVGCAGVRIESDPPGGSILYSTTGMEPWLPLGDSEKPLMTPSTYYRLKRGIYFFKVEKPGYTSTLPQLAETLPFHRETLHFKLNKTPETIEREYKALGYIRMGEKWVDPQKIGLVEFKGRWMKPGEKYAAEQREKGLVFFQGKWMTREEKETAFSLAQQEKGLVLFKGRWMTPEEKIKVGNIDNTVRESFKGDHRNLPDLIEVGMIPQELSRVSVLNGTGEEVIFFFSGYESIRMPLNPYESRNIDFPPGKYQVAVTSIVPYTRPACGRFELRAGYRYSIVEEGEPLEVESTTTFTPDEIKKQFEIPELEIPDYPTTGTQRTPGKEQEENKKERQ
jgi:hypothetical protein